MAQLLPRDAGLLCACLVGAIVSFRSGADVQLHPAWSVPIDAARFANGFYADESEQLPPPIVADLDGDGVVDVLVATPAGTLQLLDTSVLHAAALADMSDDVDGWRSLPLRAEASLLSRSVRVASGRRPVAMASGYLEHERSAPGLGARGAARQQVIVVLTDGWAVLCFNASLHLLWESAVADAELSALVSIREAALTVQPWALEPGATGVVLVAARLAAHTLAAQAGLAGLRAREAAREAAGAAPDAPAGAGAGAPAGGLGFRYFALDGGTGAVHWRQHTGSSSDEAAHPERTPRAPRLDPARLDASALVAEAGATARASERDWRLFKTSVLRVLEPELRWRRRADTALVLAHFEKEKRRAARRSAADATLGASERAAGAGAFTWLLRNATMADAPGRAAAGAAGEAAALAAEAAYRRAPNVLVCKGADGLAVLHLYTGRLLTRVALVADTAAAADGGAAVHHRIHADLNGDTVIDHVYAVGSDVAEAQASAALGWARPAPTAAGDDGDNATAAAAALSADGRGCVGVATTGMPVRRALWQASVCGRLAASGAKAMRDVAGARGARGASASERRRHNDAATRAIASSTAAMVAPLTLARFVGQERASGRDTIFLASTGRATSVGPDGAPNWYRSTGAWWGAAQLTDHVGGPDAEAVVPSLERMPAGPSALPGAEMVVLTGARHLVLLSNTGDALASVELPAVPTGSPLAVDFDQDGIADLVVPLRTMVVGYRVTHRPGSLVLKLLFGTLGAVVAVLFFRFHGAAAAGRVGRLHAKRSTD